MKKKVAYSPDLAKRMYLFFIEYSGSGVPSFSKFARQTGRTLADLERLRKVKKFNRAYLECQEIRRDYLIDRALEKRFDASFTKFLLSAEAEQTESDSEKEFLLHLEVKE